MIRGIILYICICIFTSSAIAQKGLVAPIEQLMTAGDFAAAKKLLDGSLPALLKSSSPDTLIAYPKYIGKLTAKLQDDQAAISALVAYITTVKNAGVPAGTRLRVNLECAVFFSLKGKHAMAYDLVVNTTRELAAFIRSSDIDAALVQSEMGVYAYRMGNIGLSGTHHRKATSILESLPEPNHERMYNSYNSMGTIMWFSSRIDSGIYFFDKAIAALKKLPANVENRNYRVGIVQNNLSQLYNEQGRTSEAIHTLEEGILNMKVFLASPEPNPKKDFAVVRQYQFIDNLARIYRQIGDFSRAEYLLNYSWRGKQKDLPGNTPELYISMISIGGLSFEQMNYRKAEQYLMDGLRMVQSEPMPSLLWAGEACSALSRVYDAMGKTQLAAQFYRQTDSLYELSFQGEYDETYLSFLRESAMFSARQHKDADAIAKARKGLEYIRKTQGVQTLSAQQQVLNVAEVDYQLGNYSSSLELSREALGIVNTRISASTQLLDSIKAEMSKPGAILLMTRAEYKLLKEGDVAGLKRLLAQLTEALDVLQRKRAVIKDAEDINLLMSQHRDLLDFTKELQVKLYELTGDKSLIDQVVDLHETAIYNRIRARMDKQRAVKFAEIPQSVQEKEEQLLAAVNDALRKGRNESEAMQHYFTAEKNWKQFQEMLGKNYPRYYAMRYADIERRKVNELSRFVPEGVTAIRFISIGRNYYALVADRQKQHWVPLSALSADSLIREMQDADETATYSSCHLLYKMLWQPLEKFITNKRVMVIPDGSLYYLSFEMLAARPASDAAAYVQASLLSSYAISYHYSFFALEPGAHTQKKRAGFAAFAPGFSDEVKGSYLSSLRADTMRKDNEYLSLLPLPFSVDLAKKIHREMGGALFLGNESTPFAFRSKAGNNSIIHIGTHAEANNLHPEFSRLIFAKDPAHASDSNSVFLFDIYNYDLHSDLTVLTACETGRPGFNDGEGMISMAHAFSYAGSESILTGLWKIDEKASCIITENFYHNLRGGMTKDVALQQAKLAYLATARGRTLHPIYWAGLVIMGDTSAVEISENRNWLFWGIAGAVLLVALGIFAFVRFRIK